MVGAMEHMGTIEEGWTKERTSEFLFGLWCFMSIGGIG